MDIVLVVGICCVLDEQVAAEAARPKGQHTLPGIQRQDSVHASHASKRIKVGTAIPSWKFVGVPKSSSEAVVVTEQGLAIKTRAANVRRIPAS